MTAIKCYKMSAVWCEESPPTVNLKLMPPSPQPSHTTILPHYNFTNYFEDVMWLFLVTVLAEVNLDIAFSIFLDTAQPQASLSAISSNAIFHQFLGGLDKHAQTLIRHTQGSTNNKDIFVYPNLQSTRSNQSDGSNGKVVTHTRHTQTQTTSHLTMFILPWPIP